MEVKKISNGKRVGYFFLAVLPPVLCLFMQVAIAVIVQIVMFVRAMLGTPALLADNNDFMNSYMSVLQEWNWISVLTYHIIGTVIFGIWYYFSFKKPRPSVKSSFSKFTLKGALVVCVCGVALCCFSNGTVIVEMHLMPSVVEKFLQMSKLAGLEDNLWITLAAIILAPVGEEFICRGLALKYGKKCFGNFWIANILQALLFGVMHANLVQGIYAFVIGLVAGFFVERYHTILPGILLHFVVNFSTSTWLGKALDGLPTTLFMGTVIILLSLAVIISLMCWKDKSKKIIAE